MAYDTETINIDTVEKSLWDKIVETAEGGGSGAGLPEVTSDDNGDLLGVVEGSWGKVDPPEDTYDVPFTVTAGAGGYEASTDADIDDALDAIAAGKKVRAVCDMGGGTYAYLAATAAVPESSAIVFETAGTSGGTPLLYSLKWTSPGTQLDVITIGLLPDVTSSDNGSLLGASDGAWAKVGYPLYKVSVTVTENDGVYSASTDASYHDAITQASQQSTFLYARVEGLVASRICIIPITGIDTAAAAMEFSTVLNILDVGPAFVRINWLYNGDMSISVTPLETKT